MDLRDPAAGGSFECLAARCARLGAQGAVVPVMSSRGPAVNLPGVVATIYFGFAWLLGALWSWPAAGEEPAPHPGRAAMEAVAFSLPAVCGCAVVVDADPVGLGVACALPVLLGATARALHGHSDTGWFGLTVAVMTFLWLTTAEVSIQVRMGCGPPWILGWPAACVAGMVMAFMRRQQWSSEGYVLAGVPVGLAVFVQLMSVEMQRVKASFCNVGDSIMN